MNYTTNCSRVPNTPGSNSGDIGPAPAITGQFPDTVSFNETNDGVALNPPGRVASDMEGRRSKFVTCRKKCPYQHFQRSNLISIRFSISIFPSNGTCPLCQATKNRYYRYPRTPALSP